MENDDGNDGRQAEEKKEEEKENSETVATSFMPPPAPRPTFKLGLPRGGEGGTGAVLRTNKQPFELPGANLTQPKVTDNNVVESRLREIMKQSGILYINGIRYESEMTDLKELGELGFGTSGHVFKMLHVPSQEVIAVKQMRRSGNAEENKRIAMDLEVVLKSHDCPYIVQCLGCFITQAEVWICMELMSTCFDKLLKRLGTPIPEQIIGKVTLATVRALHYLKENHDVIHRDVKPSNILLDNRGNVKLCDFGISGHLINSKANTKNAGCTAYLAPERINPPNPMKPAYDIRADVWSLGITLVELATGVFPYPGCNSDFEVLSRVLEEDPPSLPADKGFSAEFRDFIRVCLLKDYRERPKFRALLEHVFLKKYMEENVDVSNWYAHCVPVSPSPAFRPEGNSSSAAGHQRSLSDVSGPYESNSLYRFDSPLLGRRAMMNGLARDVSERTGSGPSSPLLLQRFYHQQQQAHRHRSTSVSPCRKPTYNNGLSKYLASGGTLVSGGDAGNCAAGEEIVSGGGGRRKLSHLLRGLGSCGGGSPDRRRDGGGPPEPPPRSNRGASPLLIRRGPTSPPDLTSSPILNRRYVSPSPPQPPPRRLSESVSVPGSPHHTRLAVLTPQTFRRFWQSPSRAAQTPPTAATSGPQN